MPRYNQTELLGVAYKALSQEVRLKHCSIQLWMLLVQCMKLLSEFYLQCTFPIENL